MFVAEKVLLFLVISLTDKHSLRGQENTLKFLFIFLLSLLLPK